MFTITERLNEYKNRSHYRETTIEILDRVCKWFIEMFGDIDPANITYGHIDDFKSWMVKGRSESCANTYLRMFKPFWGWLRKRGYINYDPFDGIKMYKVQTKKFEVYTPEEIERMLELANPLWKLIICLGLCGMRRAEILNLCIDDIDFKKNRLLIKGKKQTAYTWEWQIKDNEQAYIGIDDNIAKLLKFHCDRIKNTNQPYVCLKRRYWERNLELQEKGLLGHSLRNSPWGNFNRDFLSLQRRALVSRKRFHDLRGTFATERYTAGYGMKEIQRLLRHSAISTTARYIHSFDEETLVKKSGEFFTSKYGDKLAMESQ